jgi:hypothetical protein
VHGCNPEIDLLEIDGVPHVRPVITHDPDAAAETTIVTVYRLYTILHHVWSDRWDARPPAEPQNVERRERVMTALHHDQMALADRLTLFVRPERAVNERTDVVAGGGPRDTVVPNNEPAPASGGQRQ